MANRNIRRRASRSRGGMGWGGIFALGLVGLLLSGGAGAFAYFLPVLQLVAFQTGQGGHVANSPAPRGTAGATTPIPDTAVSGSAFTVLLLGSDDDQKFQGVPLTQSMILVRVNPATKHVTMVSIPRDLYVPLSTGGSEKIDAAYALGGANAAIGTVQNNFQVHVDDYVWVGLKGLIKLIDYFGGVDLTTSNPVMDDFYPADIDSNNPYSYKRVAVLPGPQHLNGHDALEYVRSRHGDIHEDFGRSARQQQVLLALRAKAKNVTPTDLPQVIASFNGEFKTSISVTDVTKIRSFIALANQLNNPDQIQQIILSGYTRGQVINGADVLIGDMPGIRALIRQYFQ